MARTRGMRRAAPGFALALALLLISTTIVIGKNFSSWGPASLIAGDVNTDAAEGCPIESFDGLSLYIASNRTGDPNDIFVAHRPSTDAPWGTPERLEAPVNSAAADFCPTPLPGDRLLFVSTRVVPGACGAGDMYFTRRHPVRGWEDPVNLGCATTGAGPNTGGGEFSPSLIETSEGTFLFFSSPGVGGLQDVYVSRMRLDGSFEPGSPVAELNAPSANDQMPNVSRDGREIVFVSDRDGPPGEFDIYVATRSTTADAWSAPVSLGPAVNTDMPETRPSLSGDGERLHFGRGGNIWVSHRSHITGSD